MVYEWREQPILRQSQLPDTEYSLQNLNKNEIKKRRTNSEKNKHEKRQQTLKQKTSCFRRYVHSFGFFKKK